MGETVLADAQFGMIKVLRPYEGFVSDYQGQTAARAIMFTPALSSPTSSGVANVWGKALDDLAGTPGYHADLPAGLKTPVGARVILYLPTYIFYNYTEDQILIRRAYTWFLMWRIRTAYCYRQNRTPYHSPYQFTTSSPILPSGSYVPMYVAGHSAVYGQEEQNNLWQPINIHTHEGMRPGGFAGNVAPINPLVPGGNQAVLNNIAIGMAGYATYEVQACGDELLLGVFRPDTSPPAVGDTNWNFNLGGTDYGFFQQIVTGGRGPRLMIGSSP
jgi:hypothetical protein